MYEEKEILASGLTFEQYLKQFMDVHCEWAGGNVIKLPAPTIQHAHLRTYFITLLATYFAIKSIGQILMGFTMYLAKSNTAGEPDGLVILKTNSSEMTSTYLNGPADICIEIVSAESDQRDHGDKFVEYEKGGVGEYWIADPLRDAASFYRLNAAGRYSQISEDAEGNYRTPALPGFALHVPTLWVDPLPNPVDIVQSVQAMLKG